MNAMTAWTARHARQLPARAAALPTAVMRPVPYAGNNPAGSNPTRRNAGRWQR